MPTICQRSTGCFSPKRGLHQGETLPMCPFILFRGRPVYLHSIFVDGFRPFPQMDVWSRWPVDPLRNGSPKANRAASRNHYRASGAFLPSSAGKSPFSLDKYLSWMSPVCAEVHPANRELMGRVAGDTAADRTLASRYTASPQCPPLAATVPVLRTSETRESGE